MNLLKIDYGLPASLEGLLHRLLSLDTVGGLTDEQRLAIEMEEAIIIEEINSKETELVAHASGLAGYWRNNKARAVAIDSELERLLSLKLECEVYKTRIEKVMGKIASLVPDNKLKTATFSLSAGWTKGAVNVTDEDALPDGYKSVEFDLERVPMDKADAIESSLQDAGLLKSKKIHVNKTDLNNALQNDVPIDGAELVKTYKVTIK